MGFDIFLSGGSVLSLRECVLVLDLVLVRSKEKCSAIKRTLSIGVTVWLKGLILRHEVEGRDERRRQFRFVVQ